MSKQPNLLYQKAISLEEIRSSLIIAYRLYQNAVLQADNELFILVSEYIFNLIDWGRMHHPSFEDIELSDLNSDNTLPKTILELEQLIDSEANIDNILTIKDKLINNINIQ